jgi:hypothetical protein
MAEIVDSVTRCEPVPGTDRKVVAFACASGAYSFELTQAAIEQLLPGLIAQAPVPGQNVVAATALSPVGCQPFESRQGLCGLAFNLGDKNLHIAVPAQRHRARAHGAGRHRSGLSAAAEGAVTRRQLREIRGKMRIASGIVLSAPTATRLQPSLRRSDAIKWFATRSPMPTPAMARVPMTRNASGQRDL